jgi:hypothetical protein
LGVVGDNSKLTPDEDVDVVVVVGEVNMASEATRLK